MKIGIVGLGLIGGSLALALRDGHDVAGFDISAETRAAAMARGIRVAERADALLPADAVIVATPMNAVLPTLATLAPTADRAVLLDTASVRAPVDAFAREQSESASIVGMHPMAGRSAHGFAAADPAIFARRPFLIVPTARTDARAMTVAGDVARAAGGTPTVVSAPEHDRIVATLSALPLAVAAALSVVGADAVPNATDLAGPGYRDATRLALTPVDLGEALLSTNSANVMTAIAAVRAVLDDLERAVAERDTAAIRDTLGRAASARSALG